MFKISNYKSLVLNFGIRICLEFRNWDLEFVQKRHSLIILTAK